MKRLMALSLGMALAVEAHLKRQETAQNKEKGQQGKGIAGPVCHGLFDSVLWVLLSSPFSGYDTPGSVLMSLAKVKDTRGLSLPTLS